MNNLVNITVVSDVKRRRYTVVPTIMARTFPPLSLMKFVQPLFFFLQNGRIGVKTRSRCLVERNKYHFCLLVPSPLLSRQEVHEAISLSGATASTRRFRSPGGLSPFVRRESVLHRAVQRSFEENIYVGGENLIDTLHSLVAVL